MTVNVLVELSNRNIDKCFTYLVPTSLENKIKVGIRVKVPFGKQKLEGFIMELNNVEEENLKEIYEVIDDEVILNEELLELGKTIKKKTLCTLISAYQAMLPKALKAQNKTNINKSYDKYIKLNISKEQLKDIKLNSKQKELIEEIINGNYKKENLTTYLSSIKTLISKGILKEELIEKYRLDNKSDEIYEKHKLNNEQQNAFNTIINDEKMVYLLHGVTGSGKTEVYMELIEKQIKDNKTSIVLVPEISLTPQIENRFRSRFNNDIAILHSRLSEGEKYDEYRKIASGKVKIVIGARSAVFAPLKNIGIIIIDEEHTTTYKQETNPKYNAIDIAIERAKFHNAKVVLGSATPSLESYAKTLANIYKLVELKNRANNKPLPKVDIIDMNKEKKKGSLFSEKLINSINDKLEKKEQIILLLNRRGYASFITCSSCGYVSKCPNCDVTLTYHKSSDMERCHYCGYATKRHDTCPNCHENAIKNLGTGTEKIEEEINKLFNAKVIRMDYDTTSEKGSHEKIIKSFRNHEYDILLGTQMIAKGLDFKDVTLVGVINADTSLMIPNFRSSEYTFQLLSQVAGRSGRSDKTGEVIIQTYNPEHYSIQLSAKQDYQLFFKKEMSIRKTFSYPPYTYLVSVKVISIDYNMAKNESTKIAGKLRENLSNSYILGPAVGSIFKVKNTYRFGITIKYKKEDNLFNYLEKLLEYYKNNSKIKIDIDFNPIS